MLNEQSTLLAKLEEEEVDQRAVNIPWPIQATKQPPGNFLTGVLEFCPLCFVLGSYLEAKRTHITPTSVNVLKKSSAEDHAIAKVNKVHCGISREIPMFWYSALNSTRNKNILLFFFNDLQKNIYTWQNFSKTLNTYPHRTFTYFVSKNHNITNQHVSKD